MQLVLWPEWTMANIIFYTVFTIAILAAGPLEKSNLSRIYYSKFRKDGSISSRAGMVVLYFVPLLAHILVSYPYLGIATWPQLIFFLAIIGHFTKRCLEVLLLHRYAGSIDALSVFQITLFYTLTTIFAAWLNRQPLAAIDGLFVVGFALFMLGEGLNFYHHKLLADLRGDSSEYVIPVGGWFKYVSCPHYCAELMAWLGLALMSRHLGMYLIFVGMFGYLAAKALKTQVWYQDRFPDYPAERKSLVPFVF